VRVNQHICRKKGFLLLCCLYENEAHEKVHVKKLIVSFECEMKVGNVDDDMMMMMRLEKS
jgi:hypothetical protein